MRTLLFPSLQTLREPLCAKPEYNVVHRYNTDLESSKLCRLLNPVGVSDTTKDGTSPVSEPQRANAFSRTL